MTTNTLPKFPPTVETNDIEHIEKDIVSTYFYAIERIESVPSDARSWSNTFAAFSRAIGKASENSALVTLPGMTHENAEVRKASNKAKDRLKSELFDATFSRATLLDVFEDVFTKSFTTTSEEDFNKEDFKFARKVMDEFTRKGTGNKNREKISENMAKIESLCSSFSSNINEDQTFVLFAESELTGVPDLKQYKLDEASGKLKVSLKAPDVMPIMQFCDNPKSREKLARAKATQCQEENTDLFLQTVKLRHETAQLLGFRDHASYVLEPKMAQTPEKAMAFLRDILDRSKTRLKKDLEMLLELKRQEEGEACTKIEPWDISYYARAHKATLGVDEGKLREYFPLEHTRDAILSTYEKLLNVTFEKQTHAQVWHEEVECYAVYANEDTSKAAGYFYLDLFPREGKYSHQCVYPLRPSFLSDDEAEVPPACVNIGNLSRSTDPSKPSLLRFREVETFFHEFGHVMHCVLTKSKHSMQAWAWSAVPWPGGVEQDFLEVPSMMLENFVWRKEVLGTLSKHYESNRALPEDEIEKLSKSRFAMDGYNRCRFISMAMYDLLVHSSGGPLYEYNGRQDLDAKELYNEMTKDMSGIDYIEHAFPVASWFHPMMGYDAGYFGYLWSEAFAADLFAEFENSKVGILDESLGKKYRECILSPCATIAGDSMLENFLGRKPSLDAFVRRMNDWF